ncbi:hypothetical protein BaRGS_00026996 [Batillaria attramentaria]|uniref:Uncharacterized protein n=1 Tax=Batillaria attramentaria TaxID=370345 RepID=A0ABD0K456_9CAEN
MMTIFFQGLKFDFKNLPKETITRDENSTLRLLFTTVASPPTCANTTLPENFTIVVSKTGEETVGTICEYRHRDRVCLQTLYSNTSCGCNTTERLYSFTKRLTRKDSGKWIWSTKPSGVITSQEMTFNIASSVTLLVAIASGVAALAAVIGFIVVAALMARRFSNGKKATEWYYKQNDKLGQTNQDLTHLLLHEKSAWKEIHQSELCQEHAFSHTWSGTFSLLQAKSNGEGDVVLFLMEPTPLTMESTLKLQLVVSPEVELGVGSGTGTPNSQLWANRSRYEPVPVHLDIHPITVNFCNTGVFVGGPMECYTDVVDQLVGAQASKNPLPNTTKDDWETSSSFMWQKRGKKY